MRGQAPDVLQMIEDHPYWDDLAASLAPELFVGKINVPTFLAGAWQDEQTGPYFANLLDNFTGTDKVWFTVTNGAHTDSLDPAILDRWIEFLQIYVAAGRTEAAAPGRTGGVGESGQQVWHTSVTLPPDRFANATSLLQAQTTFEADPRLRVLFENGAAPGTAPGLPYSRFEGDFGALAGARHPRAGVVLRRWRRRSTDRRPRTAPTPTPMTCRASQLTTLLGSGQGTVWLPLPAWQWTAPPPEDAVAYETAPLGSDTVMVGNGSVDLWIKANAPDVDLQATITEVRPDGQEVFVQSGWLRAVSARSRRVPHRCDRCTRTPRATSGRCAPASGTKRGSSCSRSATRSEPGRRSA